MTTYISRKGNTYYFRVRTPKHLVRIMHNQEFKCSLKTSCFHTAKKLALLATPGILELHRLSQQIYNTMLSEYEKLHLIEALQAHKRLAIAATAEIMQAGADRIESLKREMDEQLEFYKALDLALKQGDYDFLAGPTSVFLSNAPERIAYDFSRNNPEAVFVMQVAGRTLVDTYIEQRRILAGSLPQIPSTSERLFPTAQGQTTTGASTAPDNNSNTKPSPPTLLHAISAFLEEKEKQGIHTKNMASYRTTLQRLTEHTGNKTLDTYTRQDFITFRDKLAAQPKRKGLDATVSKSHVNSQMRKVEFFFNWCLEQEYHLTKNPCTKVAYRQDDSIHRMPFSAEDLQRLFSGALFVGNEKIEKAAYYWVPLIGLLTGARIQEICQLTLDDIKLVDGVLCFQFRPGTIITPKGETFQKSFKNRASERDVPVHSMLLTLGLMKYSTMVNPGKGNQLFPSLVRNKSNGFSHSVTKQFGTYKTSLDFGSEKVFHSFRHTMVNNLKQLKVPEVAIKEIVGHEQIGTTMAVYARTHQMSILRDYLELFQPKIDAKPFLDLPLARKELQYLPKNGKH